MSDREQEIDDLLQNFQSTCELAVSSASAWHDAAKKERAILRNEIRARLLAASSGDRQRDSDRTPLSQEPWWCESGHYNANERKRCRYCDAPHPRQNIDNSAT